MKRSMTSLPTWTYDKMLKIVSSTRFRRDLRRASRQGKDLQLLQQIITTLQNQQPLAERYRDHSLRGNYVDCRECHVQPDWLLIYRTTDTELQLVRVGSHSDLF